MNTNRSSSMTIRSLVRAVLTAMTLFLILHAFHRISEAMRPAPKGCSAPRR
jgi:hypothetical protein